MPNGRPGDSRTHDILHHQMEVFGPSIDTLVREIDPRIAEADRAAFLELIESWPFAADGTPQDPDALFFRLSALRDRLGPPRPLPVEAEAVAPRVSPPPPRRRGTPLAAAIGLFIGGFVGLPLGFLAYLVLRETVLPTTLWGSDGVMWAIIAAVAAPAALIGALQGGHPTRIGHALLIALLGFFLGSLGSGMAAGIIAFVIAAMAGIPQREGSFAMGVVFGLVPLAALAGGLLLAAWTGRRAWRNWRG